MPYNRQGAIAKLHIAAKQLGFDKDDVHDLVASFFKIPRASVSVSKLSNEQLSLFIGHLVGSTPGSGTGIPARQSGPVPIPNGATTRQLWKIRELATELGMDDNPSRLPGFIKRCTGKDSINVLTTWQASKVIEGLKGLLNNPHQESA